jgi:hypothetical protein
MRITDLISGFASICDGMRYISLFPPRREVKPSQAPLSIEEALHLYSNRVAVYEQRARERFEAEEAP